MKNFIYLYDGSFDNLLSLIEYLLKNKIIPDDIQNQNSYQPNLLSNYFQYTNDLDSSLLVTKIVTTMPNTSMHHIYYTYLSNYKYKELVIFYYIMYGMKYGFQINGMRNLKCVNKVLMTSKYVGREAHRMKGFVRFKDMDEGYLMATIEPENNIIDILSSHFQKRLGNEKWVILDNKRNIISICENQEYKIISGENFRLNEIKLSSNELFIESLWKDFFKTIGIKERKNYCCQRNFMPKKYWKYILETSEE